MHSAQPKVLHEVLGKPILSRILNTIDELHIEHIHIIVGHNAEMMQEFLVANPPQTAHSIHIQEPQLGTGHALQQLIGALEQFDGTLLVAPADTPLIQSSTLKNLILQHIQQKSPISLLSARVEDAKSYGRLVRDKDNRIARVVEDKDASPEERNIKEVNTSIYCFEWPAIKEGLLGLANNNQQKEYYLTDIIGWAYKQKLCTQAVVAEDWRDAAGINSRLELAEANRLLKDRVVRHLALNCGVTIVDPDSTWVAPETKIGRDSIIMPGCVFYGDVTIGSNCKIGPYCCFYGPITVGDHSTVTQSHITHSNIGQHCRIGPFAHIRDGSQIADHTRIGNFVEVKKSQIGNKTNVSHLSYVGDTKVGSGTNIGAGTITANYNHVTKKKSSTVIGDNVSTGSNSVLVAPVTVGDDAAVAAGTVVTKDVPEGALAVGRARQENKEGWCRKRR